MVEYVGFEHQTAEEHSASTFMWAKGTHRVDSSQRIPGHQLDGADALAARLLRPKLAHRHPFAQPLHVANGGCQGVPRPAPAPCICGTRVLGISMKI